MPLTVPIRFLFMTRHHVTSRWEFWRSRVRRPRSGAEGGRVSPAGALSTEQTADNPFTDSSAMARLQSQVVNFKDLVLGPDLHDEVEYDEDGDEAAGNATPNERTGSVGSMLLDNDAEVGLCEEDATNKSAILKQQGKLVPKVPERAKLVIILVGLPGRGKTFLCNKLKCYLNWYVCVRPCSRPCSRPCQLLGSPAQPMLPAVAAWAGPVALHDAAVAVAASPHHTPHNQKMPAQGRYGHAHLPPAALMHARMWAQVGPPHAPHQRRLVPPAAARERRGAGRRIL